ncbi:MAG TPA: preprotein translocase subunit SecE [Mycobacteriales bacterium]|nr:preprotein translocase subunit SecE [Mycobacteriales bacterium]
MARNRKRRNDRRPRRSADDASGRPGVATARGQRADGQRPEDVADRQHADEVEETPEALQHATPDVELAEAQLASGRAQAGITEPEDDGEEEEEFDDLAEGAEPPPDEEPPGTQLSSRGGASLAPHGAARLVHFLQGSWRELQRVQWPDRRQVMQATGVVIGFVIVAGVFLGAADWVAQRLVNLILK